MLAASLEWPFALRMALRVSTREDLTAGSDEQVTSLGHAPSHAHVLCQQVLTFYEQRNRVFLG